MRYGEGWKLETGEGGVGEGIFSMRTFEVAKRGGKSILKGHTPRNLKRVAKRGGERVS